MENLAALKVDDLSLDQLRNLKKKNGDLVLQTVPALGMAPKLATRELVSLLRLCPFSDWFGSTVE